MTKLDVDGILLDIEGTTSSIDFVFQVMFPFVRRELVSYVREHAHDLDVREAADLMAGDVGQRTWGEWARVCGGDAEAILVAEVVRLMDQDVKSTGLKKLQGLIWERGFTSGELEAHVYPDVPPALTDWQARGRDIRIYSSGSVHAQKLFFRHTSVGNLLPLFRGHYDTQIGSKRDASSYQRIAEDMQLAPDRIVFVSDVVEELDAARKAGVQTVLCCRPENRPIVEECLHPRVFDFSSLTLS